MSLSIAEISGILARHNLPQEAYKAIVTELKNLELDKKEEPAAPLAEKLKNVLGVVIIDTEAKASGVSKNLAGLVVQYKENESPDTILTKIYNASYAQNRAGKRKKYNITKVGEAAGGIKRKFLKEQGIAIKNKELVPVIISNNIIPTS